MVLSTFNLELGGKRALGINSQHNTNSLKDQLTVEMGSTYSKSLKKFQNFMKFQNFHAPYFMYKWFFSINRIRIILTQTIKYCHSTRKPHFSAISKYKSYFENFRGVKTKEMLKCSKFELNYRIDINLWVIQFVQEKFHKYEL